MNEHKPAKQTSHLTIVLFGFFFLYLAFMEGSLNGNSILLFLIGLCAILYGIFTSKIIRKVLMTHLHITEIDLDDEEKQK